MHVEQVLDSNAEDLILYCKTYGSHHDDSYLPDDGFITSAEQPSYLLRDGREVLGAVSLMRTARYLAIRSARFAILHSTLNTLEAYRDLVGAIKPHFHDLERVFLFIPEQEERTCAILDELGFVIERYSFVLRQRLLHHRETQFPQEFAVVPVDRDDRERIHEFTYCVNQGFSELAGHTDLSTADIQGWFSAPEHIEGGICLLVHDGEPAGTLSISSEYGDPTCAEVTALSVLERHRGRGFGRMLLRYAANFALEHELRSVVLSVNAENQTAIELYRSEGFDLVETVVCYTLDCA